MALATLLTKMGWSPNILCHFNLRNKWRGNWL